MKERWKEMSTREKACAAVMLPSSLAVVVLALLQLTDLWRDAVYLYMPLMCVNMLTQTVRFWRSGRTVALISLIGALVVLGCYIAIVIMG